jgi:O-acetyl-ADP-ribose deacetylase (regulator of RNase III)
MAMVGGSNVVPIVGGNLFDSTAQTLVNTVNCVGVMGKGIALTFRQQFPDMYREYADLCARGEVRLGRPYLWRSVLTPWVLNFPTKNDWRESSSLEAIIAGLEYLEEHYKEWGIQSLAVPPLGSGLGGLDWRVVGPTLYQHLARLKIPVELYAPIGTPDDQLTLDFFLGDVPTDMKGRARLPAAAVAIASVVGRLAAEPYSPKPGRIVLQKIAYFLTEAGVPTGLTYTQSSYGPFAPDFAEMRRKLLNHSVLVERPDGRFLPVEPGPTLRQAQDVHAEELAAWAPMIDRVVDLFMRLRTGRQAEVAATVHYAAEDIRRRTGTVPDEEEVLEFVRQWKKQRNPPLADSELALAIRGLNVLGWLDVRASSELPVPP